LEDFDPYVKQWRVANPQPDILFIAMIPTATVQVIEAIRRDGWQPKAIMTNHGGFLQQLTDNTVEVPWMVEGVIAGDSWDSSVNNPDPHFGDTVGFNTAYMQFANHTPTTLQGAAFAAGLVLKYALESTPTLAAADIIKAMLAVDKTSFWGPLRFKPDGSLDFDGVCLQIRNNKLQVISSSTNATAASNLTVVYPLQVSVPKHYFDSGYHRRQTTKWILVGVIPGVFLIVVAVIVILWVIRSRFHLIWIPKSGEDGTEWGE